MTTSDSDLAAAVQAGDKSAFDAIYRAHRYEVAGACKGFTRIETFSRADVHQETWLTAYRWLRAGAYHPGAGSLKTWLHYVAKHTVSKLSASAARKINRACVKAIRVDDPDVLFELPSRAQSPLDALEHADNCRMLRDALATLPMRDRMIATAALKGTDKRAVGFLLGVSHQRVGQIAGRACEQLRHAVRASAERGRRQQA